MSEVEKEFNKSDFIDYVKACKEIQQLQEENKLLRECVEYYADVKTYGKTNQNHFNRLTYSDCSLNKAHFYDGVWYSQSIVAGMKARETLAKIKGDI